MHLRHQPGFRRNSPDRDKNLAQIDSLKGIHHPTAVQRLELTFHRSAGADNLNALDAAQFDRDLQ